ncbi:(2Fe-2S)-binding protein [Elioraea sp.]|uniref:(2Fe-2S)-binding protein n=1 Tax=Elioraea sp. TaxID=2185103 RepID=UPI003F71C439
MLTRPDPGGVTILFEDAPIRAREGESVASALLAAGILAFRTTAVSGAPRGPFCMMGACFDCLAVVDGVGGVQTCLVPVREGMRVERQHGVRDVAAEDAA